MIASFHEPLAVPTGTISVLANTTIDDPKTLRDEIQQEILDGLTLLANSITAKHSNVECRLNWLYNVVVV